MLAEIDPTDVVRVYGSNKRKFKTEFTSMSNNRQRYIAYQVLNYLKGGNE